MAKDFTVCVGTLGMGIWRSSDGGENWGRARGDFPVDSRVYGVTAHPQDPEIILAGTHVGIYRSDDRGVTFEHLDTPMNDLEVWKIAFDASNPDIIFAGTRPAGIFRSQDGGQHWGKMPIDVVEECPNVGLPRVTGLTVDPTDGNNIWVGIEVDGARRSLDGGNTWTRVAGGVDDPDIHDTMVCAGNPKTVLISTPGEIFASTDSGEAFRRLGVQKSFPMPYCRGIAQRADNPSVVFVANGNGPVGDTGAIQRTQDLGDSWETLSLPVAPNAPIWAFATHASDPDLVLTCSHYGQVFASADGGDWWIKMRREFTEIRGLAWVPN